MNAACDSRSGIIAAGNWIVDNVKLLDRWPPQDALANILSESWGNGGSPYNILKNLAKLGASFPLWGAGLIGDDPNGVRILDDCRQHGIDTTQLRKTEEAMTSYSDVLTESTTGRRTFFHYRGANALFGADDVDFTGARARHFHLGYMLLLDALDALGEDGKPGHVGLLARARAAGLSTSIDCVSENSDRFVAVILATLPEVDVLFANDFEAEKLTGRTLGRGAGLLKEEFAAAAGDLLRAGVQRRVVIHAPEGVCAVNNTGDAFWQPSVEVPPAMIAGAAGAGDALAAGILYGWHENWAFERALELGVCAAAMSLTCPACSDGVETMDACLRFGRTHGYRGEFERWSTCK